MSAIQNSPTISKNHESEYDVAKKTVKGIMEGPDDTKDVLGLYENSDKKNNVKLLLKCPSTPELQQLLDKVIKVSEKRGFLNKFKDLKPFKVSLKHNPDNFEYLLQKYSQLIEDTEILDCFSIIINKNLLKQCHSLIKKLPNFEWISKGENPLLIQAIEKNCEDIFRAFLSHLHESISPKPQYQNILSSLIKKKNFRILHAIAKQSNGKQFLRVLWHYPLPKSRAEETPGCYSKEIVDLINKNDPDGKTPLFLAAEQGNADLVEYLIELGANFETESNEKLSKDIAKDPVTHKKLRDAKYGFIDERESLPEEVREIIRKRKAMGLMRCCEDGLIDDAKKLIKEYKINPLIINSSENSLVMILLNQNKNSNDIIQFIDFLGKGRLNAKQTNSEGNNLLMLAILKDPKVALHLIDKYHDQFDVKDKNNNQDTILTLASKEKNITVFQTLSQKYSIDLNAKIGEKTQGSILIFNLFENLKKTKTEDLEIKEKTIENLKNEIKQQTAENKKHSKEAESHEIQLNNLKEKLENQKKIYESQLKKIQINSENSLNKKEIIISELQKNLEHQKKSLSNEQNLKDQEESYLAKLKELKLEKNTTIASLTKELNQEKNSKSKLQLQLQNTENKLDDFRQGFQAQKDYYSEELKKLKQEKNTTIASLTKELSEEKTSHKESINLNFNLQQKKIEEKNSLITKLEEDINKKNSSLETQKKTLQETNKTLSKRENELKNLEEYHRIDLHQQELTIDALKKENSKLKSQQINNDSSIEEKKNYISYLEELLQDQLKASKKNHENNLLELERIIKKFIQEKNPLLLKFLDEMKESQISSPELKEENDEKKQKMDASSDTSEESLPSVESDETPPRKFSPFRLKNFIMKKTGKEK